jgi:hypothetical protein
MKAPKDNMRLAAIQQTRTRPCELDVLPPSPESEYNTGHFNIAKGLSVNTYRLITVGCVLMMLLSSCGRQPAEETANSAATIRPRAPRAAYSVEWTGHDIPQAFVHGTNAPVHITAKNTGDWWWPDPVAANAANPHGAYAVRLGYRWRNNDTNNVAEGGSRADLPAAVPPGGTAAFDITVDPPSEPGKYQLEFDLVEELVTWFGAQGSQTLSKQVQVR